MLFDLLTRKSYGFLLMGALAGACTSERTPEPETPFRDDVRHPHDSHSDASASDAAPNLDCQRGFITHIAGPSIDAAGQPAPEYGPGSGFGQDRYPDVVFGPPQGSSIQEGSLDVLSLGAKGTVIVGFADEGITDGEGADFIVFENVLYELGDPSKPYAELGEISVSSDLETWHTFPCASDEQPYIGCAGWHPTYAHPDNSISPFDPETAGGEAFDLAELGLAQARYVRIRDLNNTGFGGNTSGFDLDAISVIHPACALP